MPTIENVDLPYYQKQFRKFEEEYGASINLIQVSWNKAFSWLVNSFKEGEAPDVFQLGSTWVQTFARLGYLAPVPDYVFKPVLADWMRKCCQWRGEWVGLPWHVDIRDLLVREDKLKKITGKDCSEINSPGICS